MKHHKKRLRREGDTGDTAEPLDALSEETDEPTDEPTAEDAPAVAPMCHESDTDLLGMLQKPRQYSTTRVGRQRRAMLGALR